MQHRLFTSESVCKGHPDKIADQISDAILDQCLKEDKDSRVSCDVLLSQGLVFITGQITTQADLDYPVIARKVIKEIGYDDSSLGFDLKTCEILVNVNKQSVDISQAVKKNEKEELKAGDQGLMFGFASDETPELMPIPIMIAHQIVKELSYLQQSKKLSYLRPDGKCQVTFEYDEKGKPLHLDTVVVSVQHEKDVSQDIISKDMKNMLHQLILPKFLDEKTKIFINPSGRFVIGGPVADTGITGRKIIVDTYGGMGRHGGGSFSGKDATKMDRSGAYAARYVAKNIVSARLAKKCEVQLAYAIGLSYPISIRVDTFGTGAISESDLEEVIPKVFSLSPEGIMDSLKLNRPVYQNTAFGGHFGRNEMEFLWEKTDKASALKDLFHF